MNAINTQLALDDLLADLRHARRTGDLGRLAFITYCEVRRWARQAGEVAVAERASNMVISSPHASREQFLEQVDALVRELELVRPKYFDLSAGVNVRTAWHPVAQGVPRS